MSGELASGGEAAHVRISDAQVFVGIYRDVIDADFIVKMGTGAAAAIAHVADRIAAVDVLAGKYRKALQVAITGRDAVAVV